MPALVDRTKMMARRAAKAALYPAGHLRRARAGDLVILLYHRVGAGSCEVDLTASSFRRQLEMLGERHRVLSLDEALAGDHEGGVVVTFDDGYRDFYDHALPLLVSFGIPATLYLTTGLVDDDRGPDDLALTWAELREAASTGLVTIGAHTHTHPDLSNAPPGTALDEMTISKNMIEERLGVKCRHFAYPFSVWNEDADRTARSMFDSIAALSWNTNRAGTIDPYRLGRVPITRSDSDLFFRAKARGALDNEAWLYRVTGRGPWRDAHVHHGPPIRAEGA
jgi:peptidoglycan/xylan/chitin deacetylase (PgdA/CDA1 family)